VKRLLHDISHELRSPLTRLNIALELARNGNEAETGWALDRNEREANRLNDLIGQLLGLARMDGEPPKQHNTAVDLRQLVDEIVVDADFEARSDSRFVSLVASQDCVAVGNEQLLRSAIENVVRNAVSYTAEGTTVEVSLLRQAGKSVEEDRRSSRFWIQVRASLRPLSLTSSTLFIVSPMPETASREAADWAFQ
jgi:two-component system sensor histidine kinase CpxA